MLKHKMFIQKGIILIILIFSLVSITNKIMMPKYFYDNTWPTTSTFIDFYKLDKNTVDVLFLGSSHSVACFSPQKLYDDFSIRSYNLSSEQQNLLVSYYWLREALKYQEPKVVVLDTYILFPYNNEEVLNSAESTTRKAIDLMHWSQNKIEAVNDIVSLDEKQSKASYYFTNIRFHTRWKGLNEDDFTFWEMESHRGLKGFSALSGHCMNGNYAPFKSGTSEETAEILPVMKEYLDRIVSLCEKEGIKLILVKTPTTAGNIAKYNTLMDYAHENKISYVDYNEENIYQECGFEFPKDASDNEHLNIWGAEKVTGHIGRYLEEHIWLEKAKDVQWSSSASHYADVKKNCDLTEVTDIRKYLHEIKDDRYTIFMSIKDEGVSALDDDLRERLKALGLASDFNVHNSYRKSYYAIIEKENVIEDMSEKAIERKGTLRNGREGYQISSAGFEAGNTSSINISGIEYSKNQRGFNIVVYDNNLKKVIDSVAFDTYDAQLTAIR